TVQLHLTGARGELERLANAQRYGEMQLEKTVAHLRELHGQRRVQDAALRILAGLERLRLALGDAAAPAGAAMLRAACDHVAAGSGHARPLIHRPPACAAPTQGPAYGRH